MSFHLVAFNSYQYQNCKNWTNKSFPLIFYLYLNYLRLDILEVLKHDYFAFTIHNIFNTLIGMSTICVNDQWLWYKDCQFYYSNNVAILLYYEWKWVENTLMWAIQFEISRGYQVLYIFFFLRNFALHYCCMCWIKREIRDKWNEV